MTELTVALFTCNGCGQKEETEPHIHAPMGWRALKWSGGYVGDEKREAHFCPRCRDARLKALDVLLGSNGEGMTYGRS